MVSPSEHDEIVEGKQTFLLVLADMCLTLLKVYHGTHTDCGPLFYYPRSIILYSYCKWTRFGDPFVCFTEPRIFRPWKQIRRSCTYTGHPCSWQRARQTKTSSMFQTIIFYSLWMSW